MSRTCRRIQSVLWHVLALSLLVCAHAHAETRRIAVLDLENKAGLDDAVADLLTDVVRGEAARVIDVLVMTREHITEQLPPGQDLATCYEGDCDVEIGRNLGADYIVSGQMLTLGGQLKANLKLFDTARGAQLSLEVVTANSPEELETAMKTAAARLFVPMGGLGLVKAPAERMFGAGLPERPLRIAQDVPPEVLTHTSKLSGFNVAVRQALARARRRERAPDAGPRAKARAWIDLAATRGAALVMKRQAVARSDYWMKVANEVEARCWKLQQVRMRFDADRQKLSDLLNLGDDASTLEERATWHADFQATYGPWKQVLVDYDMTCTPSKDPYRRQKPRPRKLKKGQVSKVIQQHTEGIRACGRGVFKGVVWVQVRVGPAGEVVEAEMRDQKAGQEEVNPCVLRHVQGFKFKRFDGLSMILRLPFQVGG